MVDKGLCNPLGLPMLNQCSGCVLVLPLRPLKVLSTLDVQYGLADLATTKFGKKKMTMGEPRKCPSDFAQDRSKYIAQLQSAYRQGSIAITRPATSD